MTAQFDDPKDEHKHDKTSLDVAFILDCTGSMSSYIGSCKDNIISISNQISKEVSNCDVQFALVTYRDIPPQDKTFITKILNFTPIPFQIQIELEQTSAKGGGDAPECLTSALYDCYKNLKWRQKSIKVIIVITDAPPHGLETQIEDGFPNGDPDTFSIENNDNEGAKNQKHLNVIEIIQSIRDDLKAAIYSVACEPVLSRNHDFANDFMQYIAEYTKGRFLPLSSAKLLPEVIVGSVKQQINFNSLKNKLGATIQEIKREHGNDISSDQLNKLIAEKWKNAGVKKKEISIGTLYRNKRRRDNIELLLNQQKTKSLQDFKANCVLLPRLKMSDFRHLETNKKEVGSWNCGMCTFLNGPKSHKCEMCNQRKPKARVKRKVVIKRKAKTEHIQEIKEYTSFDAVALATLLLASENVGITNENLKKVLTAANISMDPKYIEQFAKAESKGMDLKALLCPENALCYSVQNAGFDELCGAASSGGGYFEEESEKSSSAAGAGLFGCDDSSSDSDSDASQQVYEGDEDMDEDDIADLFD